MIPKSILLLSNCLGDEDSGKWFVPSTRHDINMTYPGCFLYSDIRNVAPV